MGTIAFRWNISQDQLINNLFVENIQRSKISETTFWVMHHSLFNQITTEAGGDVIIGFRGFYSSAGLRQNKTPTW